ncbi:MAG: BamA/TamA family outer membrane protein, partial [candidate division Zixibacteria bacterium]|nr:BamA/TamA family outer membrane protein [candidate division Zixibacteria bacterium]
NYETVPAGFTDTLMTEVDSSTNAYLTVEADFDTGDPEERFASSAWKVSSALEYAHPDFSSDFSYRRYTLAVTRFQKVHRRSMLIMRGMYGGSDGYLPIYKRYFLGGLGTLRGYRHKEYMGTRFWMVNTEYRTRFPGSDISASLIWDLGKIGNDTALDSDVDLKHSLGFALTLGDDFRISIAKRLDRSEDNDPRIYVRLAQPF